jgi:hypothetical protein
MRPFQHTCTRSLDALHRQSCTATPIGVQQSRAIGKKAQLHVSERKPGCQLRTECPILCNKYDQPYRIRCALWLSFAASACCSPPSTAAPPGRHCLVTCHRSLENEQPLSNSAHVCVCARACVRVSVCVSQFPSARLSVSQPASLPACLQAWKPPTITSWHG